MDGTVRVLHVDDEPEFARLSAELLEREETRLQVRTETSGGDGLDELATGDYDCIVSDFDMDGMNGLAFLEAVRGDYPDLPFVLFTGKGSEAVASDAISAGVTDYLQKGHGTEQYELLANRITNAVDQYRAEQRASAHERTVRLTRAANQALVRATTRSEIEERICEVFAGAEPYVLAWIGDYDDGRVVPRTIAGVPEVAPRAVSAADGPTVDALRSGDVVTASRREEHQSLAPWEGGGLDDSPTASAVVPLRYQGTEFGFVVLGAQRDVFEDAERAMLTELGDDTAHAIHAAEVTANLRQHRTVVETVPVGVYVLDEDATIDLANGNAARLTGHTVEELSGTPFPQLVEAGILDRDVIDWYLEIVPELLSSSADRGDASYVTEVTPPDGERRTIEILFTLRPYDESFRGTVGIIRDVTDRGGRDGEYR